MKSPNGPLCARRMLFIILESIIMKAASVALALALIADLCGAQSTNSTDSTSALRSLAPATKLEAFQPKAGELSTMGFTALGGILAGLVVKSSVHVDVREIKNSDGVVVRGAVVEINTGPPLFRSIRSFIDEEELPDLIKGIDALLAVKSNPTGFKSYRVQYRTRGEFELSALGSGSSKPQYSITTGRVFTESRSINEGELKQVRQWMESARAVLSGGSR